MAKSTSLQRNLQEEITLTSSGFIFDHVTGLTYTVNVTGGFILKKLMEGTSAADTIKAIMTEFEVTESTARKDLEDFLEQTKSFGVI